MKASTKYIAVIVALVVIAAAAYWLWGEQAQAPTQGGPSGAAGINGSENQGNLGQPDTGTPQQPGDQGVLYQ